MPRSEPAPEATTAREPLEFDQVYRAHAQTIARWASRIGGPQVDVEDIVQEVFLIVHRLLPTYRGDAKITTWLYRITENVVRHRRRKERWRRWLGGSADEVAGHKAAPGATPSEAMERREASATVYRALEGVSEKYRNVLILFEIEEMSGEEIAALTGAKAATVWVWLHRARAQFLDRLMEIEAEEAAR